MFPPEIIHEIVPYLKDDKKTLYSCLFVSRDWCREAIRLLWRRPFHFLYTCSIVTETFLKTSKFKHHKRHRCRCSKTKLKSQAGNLLMTYLSIKYNNEIVKDRTIKTKDMMFNYLEFLCELDIRELFNAIKDWNYSDYDGSNINSIKIIWFDIFEFLFTNSSKLKSLSLDIEAINPCLSLTNLDDLIVNELLTSRTKTPVIKQVFTSLTEFVFTTKASKTQLFSFLSQNCHNIQKLIVRIKIPPKVKNPCSWPRYIPRETLIEIMQLASLISSQSNLVYFELFDTVDECTSEILMALEETQCNSLEVLILNSVFFSNNDTILYHLKYLKYLQELRLNECIYVRTSIKFDCEDLWLPYLKYLEVSFVGKQENYSHDLTSILLECSPLLEI